MSKNIYEGYAELIGRQKLTTEEKREALSPEIIRSVRMHWTGVPWIGRQVSWCLKSILYWITEGEHKMDEEQLKLLKQIVEAVE